ncbi:unnamed protein product, partial [Didymodactylos carnosus]
MLEYILSLSAIVDASPTTYSTTTPAESPSSCSKSTFLLLPNELLLFIFIYLKSTEIIEIFFNLNARINNLIFSHKHINEIDITQVDQTWIKKYLHITQPCINKLKFEEQHLAILFGQPSSLSQNIPLLYPKLHTIIFTEIDDTHNDDIKMYIEQFKILHQSTLILIFTCDIHQNLYIQLFQHNTHLETLHIDSNHISPSRDDYFPRITQNFYIKHLHIALFCLYQTFILFENLLQLESIHIDISHTPFGTYEGENFGTKPITKHLKRFSLHGLIEDFEELTFLIKQFSLTLEYLSLRIKCHTDVRL